MLEVTRSYQRLGRFSRQKKKGRIGKLLDITVTIEMLTKLTKAI